MHASDTLGLSSCESLSAPHHQPMCAKCVRAVQEAAPLQVAGCQASCQDLASIVPDNFCRSLRPLRWQLGRTLHCRTGPRSCTMMFCIPYGFSFGFFCARALAGTAAAILRPRTCLLQMVRRAVEGSVGVFGYSLHFCHVSLQLLAWQTRSHSIFLMGLQGAISGGTVVILASAYGLLAKPKFNCLLSA